MSLFTRLLLIIIAALLPPLAMQVFNESALREAREADVRGEAAREARGVSTELERITDGVRNTLVALAEVPAIRVGEPAQCAAVLRAVKARFVFLRQLELIDADGRSRCSSGPQAGRDRSGESEVQLARARDDFAIGTYGLDGDGQPVLPMGYRVPGLPGALLLADFDLGWLHDQLLGNRLPPGSTLAVVDRNGIFLLRLPDSSLVGTPIRAERRWLLTQPTPGVIESVGRDGLRRIVGYVPMATPLSDLFVSTGFSTDYTYAASDAAARRGYTLIGAGLLVALALAAWMVRGMITRPVRAILATTGRWQAGDTSARVALGSSSSEFARIGSAVNTLLDAVAAGQAGLRDRLAELDAVYRSSAVGLGFVDHALRFVTVNAQLAEISGLPEAAHRGQKVRDVLAGVGGITEPLLRRALAGEHIAPAEVSAASGGAVATAASVARQRRMLVSYQPAVAQGGQVLGAVVSVQDISALRRAEAALQDSLQRDNAELERRVAERTRQLQAEVAEREATQAQLQQAQKMELLGQLTGGVAHDFNNLLTAIIGNLELALAKTVDPPDVERLLRSGLRAADRGAALTQRMLAFGRRQYLRFESVAIAPLLDGMADLLARTIAPPVGVRIEIAPNLRPARADPNQVELLVLNLAVNARDAMPEGGVITITADEEEVADDRSPQVRLDPGCYVRITVADTGTGMDAATAARAFEPFFTTKPVGHGTGLGLSMVQGVAEQSGGGAAIETAPGRGTRVSVWLPCEAAGPAPAEGPQPVPLAGRPAAGRLLLVDDDAAVRVATAATLEEVGYDVMVAGDGETALALLRAGPLPNLLIVDLDMAGMGGTEFIAKARRIAPLAHVLIATGYGDAAASFGYPVLGKPFHAAELYSKVAALLRAAA